MRNILDEIKLKAKALQKTIVLCEGEDKRVVKAAADATKEGVAKIVLLGNEAEIKAANPEIDLTGVTIIDPLTSDKLPAYNAKAGAQNLVNKLKTMQRELSVPQTLKDCNVTKEAYESVKAHIIQSALNDACTVTNPRKLNESDIEKILINVAKF